MSFAGMTAGCEQILKRLKEGNLLDRVMNQYADYTLVLTGHSLGAGGKINLNKLFPRRWLQYD